MDKSERTILASVKSSLNKHKIFYERIQTTGIFTPFGIVKDQNAVGRADIIGLHKGQMFAIETKSTKGVQRKAQILWEKRFIAAGGGYYLIRDEQGIQAFLKALQLA